MSDFLKLYSYPEFINEYGEIVIVNNETATLLTIKNIVVNLSCHYKKPFINKYHFLSLYLYPFSS